LNYNTRNGRYKVQDYCDVFLHNLSSSALEEANSTLPPPEKFFLHSWL
jgi:hypothetical protein